MCRNLSQYSWIQGVSWATFLSEGSGKESLVNSFRSWKGFLWIWDWSLYFLAGCQLGVTFSVQRPPIVMATWPCPKPATMLQIFLMIWIWLSLFLTYGCIFKSLTGQSEVNSYHLLIVRSADFGAQSGVQSAKLLLLYNKPGIFYHISRPGVCTGHIDQGWEYCRTS